MQEKRKVILASSSPRRRELLEKIGLKFGVVASLFEEDLSQGLPPEELVKAISLGKAREVGRRYPDAIIIAADTLGVRGKRVFGKPGNQEEARQMLSWLSGKSHRVITGYTILDGRSKKTVSKTVETRVFLKKLSAEEIGAYVASGEPLDKAGAYAIQGLGSLMVEKIVGDYYNVMGLPLSSLVESLKEFGIRIL